MTAWLPAYRYRKSHIINADADGNASTDYQVKIVVDYGSTSYNFGDTTTGANAFTIENFIRACLFTSTHGGTATQIKILLDSDTVDATAKAAIYASDLSQIETTDEQTVTGGAAKAWYTFTFNSTVTVQPNTQYYLCVWSESVNGAVNVWGTASATINFYTDPETYNGWPDPLVFAPGAQSYSLSMYLPVSVTMELGDTAYLNGRCQTDFDDIRFTDDDGVTELDYWLESKTDSDTATFWVEVADDLGAANQTVYMYFGNMSASSTSSGDNTFPEFTHFDDSALPSGWSRYQDGGVPVETYTSTTVKLDSQGAGTLCIYSDQAFGDNYCVRARWLHHGSAATWGLAGFGTTPAATDPYADGRNDCSRRYEADANFCLVCSNGGSTKTDMGVAHDHDVWHVSEAAREGANTYLLIDTTSQTNNQNAAENRKVYVADRSATGTYIECDWMLVRKYVNPEPQHSTWSSEEKWLTRLRMGVGL